MNITTAVTILNKFRYENINCEDEEKRECAEAINEVLPTFARLLKENDNGYDKSNQ